MQLSLALDEFVVFDLETTGLSPWAGDEVIEIGAMKIYGQEIDEVNSFHSLVNPGRIIPEDATKVNGITNEMVAAAPPFDEVFQKFLDFVGEAHLVAQNAKFDMSFLMKYMMTKQMQREMQVHDTMLISRRCFPDETKHNLDVICNRLQLPFQSNLRHRSMEDVRLTAHAFVRMREMLGDNCPSSERWSV